jgi:ribonucleoside-diphosphate reductase alpha chain
MSNATEPVQGMTNEDTALARELNAQVNLWSTEGEGHLQLDKDREATKAYFLDHVNTHMRWFHDGLEEKLAYMFGENNDGPKHEGHEYYDKAVFDQYEPSFIKAAYKRAYAYKFRFVTFMGAFSFFNKYGTKSLDGKLYLERFEDRTVVVALTLGRGDTRLVNRLIDEIMSGRLVPATPTFSNAGKKNAGMLVSCRLLEVSDSLHSIMVHGADGAAQLSKMGAGVALNITSIRAADDPVKGVQGAGVGILPWCKIFESVVNAVDQGGKRAGACAVYYSAHGWDVLEFLDSKKVTADEQTRLSTLSLGLIVPDITYHLAAENKQMALFSPYDVEKVYGVPFSDINITERYEEMAANPLIRKKYIKARDLFRRIAKVQGESGYPYLLNIDTVNRANPIDGIIKHSNLCTEIVQVSTPSLVNDDREYEVVGRDVSCNLASLNVALFMRSPDFGKSIETAMLGLTAVSDMDDCSIIPSLKKGNDLSHSVGLGMMNLAGAIAGDLGVEYDSEEARDFASVFTMMMNFHSIRASKRIAQQTGETFFEFEKSAYADGSYFDMYTEQEFTPKTKLVREFFEQHGHHVPTSADWKRLKASVMRNGMYHAYRLAIAPTGSISYLSASTPSVAPAIAPVETRKENKLGVIYVPAYGLRDDNINLYKDAYTVGPKALIDMMAVIQPHIDQAISTTLFYKFGTKGKELYKAQRYAWMKGLKSLYYTRVQNTQSENVEGCVACAV